jgi:16S rRNA processing protein RimM
VEPLETSDLVAVARVVRTRGLKGEVVAEILTDFPERFEALKSVVGVRNTGEQFGLNLEKFWFQNDRVILKFEGFDNPDTAESLRNVEICIAEGEAVELEADEFYDWELAGCKVETIDGGSIGTVAELMRTGGTELLVVRADLKEYLIPFAETICVEVDIENKLIRIDPPEGLLDF